MWHELIERLICPQCQTSALKLHMFHGTLEDSCFDGVVVCDTCSAWYPIEDGLLSLLIGALAYPQDREAFFQKHQVQFEALSISHINPENPAAIEQQLEQQSHFDEYQQDHNTYWTQPFWLGVDQMIIPGWLNKVKVGNWLLDIGCAQGRSTLKFAPSGAKIVGIDVSKQLIREAIDNARAANLADQAIFLAADGSSQLPFQDQTFGNVHLYGVLHHLPDPELTCQEITRVLHPEGIYFGVENNPSIMRGLFDFLQRMNPLWPDDAGPSPMIAPDDLSRWFDSNVMDVQVRTGIFVPPHIINPMGVDLGYQIIKFTDSVGQAIPFVRDQGGLIFIQVRKK